MIGKIAIIVLLAALAGFSVFYIYQYLPSPPVDMEIQEVTSISRLSLDYGTAPVFSENLRFNHNNISYSIDQLTCSEKEIKYLEEAFRIFQEKMEVINFTELSPNNEDTDIKVSCPDETIDLGNSLFAAGEGGPSRIVNTSLFKTIQEGIIYIYEPPTCDYPVVELHELGHVFGFDHSENTNNIMYNTSNCQQRISEDMIKLIKQLYSIQPLPELRISEVEAVKKGRYLDFNVTILDEGLIGADNATLTILSGEKEVQKIYLGEVTPEFAKTLKATNVKLPSRDIQEIVFVVDIENNYREYNEENNIIKMRVQSQ